MNGLSTKHLISRVEQRIWFNERFLKFLENNGSKDPYDRNYENQEHKERQRLSAIGRLPNKLEAWERVLCVWKLKQEMECVNDR